MKKLLCLFCLYPFLVFAGAIYLDTDIAPANAKMLEFFKERTKKEKEDKAFAGYTQLMALHFYLCSTEEIKKTIKDDISEDDAAKLLAFAMQFYSCELYAVDYYHLNAEYLQYLESPELAQAAEKIKKDIEKHSKILVDCLDYIHEELSVAMKKTSPKLAQIYKSSKYTEASLRMFFNSKDKVKKKEPKQEVEDLMVMNEIIKKRLREALDGFAPEDFPETLHQMAIDLRSYYRLSDCPDDFAYVFVDYLAAIDDLDMWAMSAPKDVKPEEAFATVFIWTLAGGNPLEPALMNEQKNAEWQTKGRELQKKLADAENKLNKAAIKYGLRL